MSRSLCNIKNKYCDFKQVKIDLEGQLSNSCSNEELKNIKDKNVRLRE